MYDLNSTFLKVRSSVSKLFYYLSFGKKKLHKPSNVRESLKNSFMQKQNES